MNNMVVEFMRKKITVFSLVASMFLSTSTLGATPFKDISDHWGRKEIEWGYTKGIAKGVTEDEFAPDKDVTRAMFITMLYRLEGSPEVDSASAFKDVTKNDYYYDAVNWAHENKITDGVSEDYFGSIDNITREDMATMLYRKEKMNRSLKAEIIDKYSDKSEISDYAEEAIKWAVKNKIINGYEDDTLKPKNNATRAETMAVLLRYDDNRSSIEKDSSYENESVETDNKEKLS